MTYLRGFFLSKLIVTPRLSSYSKEQISSMFIEILETILLQSGHLSTIPRLLKHITDQWQLSHNSKIISGSFSPLILYWTVFISSVGITLLSGDKSPFGFVCETKIWLAIFLGSYLINFLSHILGTFTIIAMNENVSARGFLLRMDFDSLNKIEDNSW